MALLDAVHSRLTSLIAGTYPVTPGPSDRAINAGTFTPGKVWLPAQNPEWPKVAMTRQYDLVYSPPRFDRASPTAVNTRDASWFRELPVEVRVQYAIERPAPLAPRDRELVLGALTSATLRAANDAALLEWVLLWPSNWQGVASGARWGAAPSTTKTDPLRLVLSLPLLLILRQDARVTPGAWV